MNAVSRSSASYPFVLPTMSRPNSQIQALKPGSDFAMSVQIDTSGVNGNVDQTEAGSKATGIAANRARESVNMLEDFAKGAAGIANGREIGTLTLDRNGQLLSRATLDGDGDLTVYGRGSWSGVSSQISMFIPSINDNGGDWLSRASSAMALAAYNLTSILDQVSGGSQDARISMNA